jgi:hemoglobin/transferrin/lactoferrin receptor protein
MKLAYIYLIIHLSSLLTFSLTAQKLTILDAVNLKPVEGAIIQFEKEGIRLQSDKFGQFDWSNAMANDEIFISHPDYKPLKLSRKQLEESGNKVYLNSNIIHLDEVIISAGKIETKRSDLPVQTLAIGKSQIEFSNPATMADLMQSSGEIMVQKSQQGGGSPVMRGFEANKVLLVVDGVRMNNAIYRGGHLQNIITMDPAAIEKTEVIFGPSSVIYGSDALGGVIHFYTKQPKLSGANSKRISADAMIRYATANNEKSAQLGFNLGFKSFASYTGASYSDFDDLRQGAVRNPFYGDWGKRLFYAERINGRDTMLSNGPGTLQKQSGYKQYNVLQKFRWNQNEKLNHLLNIQYSTSSDIYRYDRLTEVNQQGVLRSAQWYYGPQDRLLVSYVFSYKPMNRWVDNFDINLAYQNIEESRHNRNFGNSALNHRIEKLNILSANIDFFKQHRKHKFQYGIEANHNDVNSTAYEENILDGIVAPLDTRYPDGGAKMSTAAIFAAHQWKMNDAFILHDGFRFNYTSLSATFIDKTYFPIPVNDIEQQNASLTGSIGAVIKLGKGIHITPNISTGFRAPNVDDLAKVFESTSGSLVIPNQNLEPEYVYNTELGIRKMFSNNSELSVTGYYTWYQNVITRQKTQFNGQDSIVYNGTLSQVFAYQNASNAYLYGISTKLNLNFDEQWSLSSSLSYTYARIKTDTSDYPLDHIPPMFGKTALQWKVKKWNSECSVLYNGWKRWEDYNLLGEDNQVYASSQGSPAWWTLNFRTSYQFHKNFQLQLAVENIFDTYYRVFASGISAPGRNIITTLRFNL